MVAELMEVTARLTKPSASAPRRFAEWISCHRASPVQNWAACPRPLHRYRGSKPLFPLECISAKMLQYAPSATARYLPEPVAHLFATGPK